MPNYVIAGAQVYRRGRFEKLEVRTDGTMISEVAAKVNRAGAEIIDAGGLHLFPGVIDPQVHFREPGKTYKEDLETASRACAAGGVTSFCEMPNTEPPATNQTLIDQKLDLAKQKSRVNYGFFIGATPNNVADLASAKRVCGIKIFMGASTGTLLVENPDDIERIFANTPKSRVIAVHAEDEKLMREHQAKLKDRSDFAVHSEVRDVEVALRATKLAVMLAMKYSHRLHVLHCSSARETELFTPGRGIESKTVTAEVCPHHLLLNVNDYARLGTLAKMNPSLKSPEDNRGLWSALHEGRIDCIATDHAPHTLEEKAQDIWKAPSGIPLVENSLALMLDSASKGLCKYEEVAHWMCEAPARIYRMKRKGFIEPGYDADLALIDFKQKREIRNEKQYTKVKWSPFHGQTLQGWTVQTFVRGQKAYENGQVIDSCRGAEIEYA